MPFSWAHPSLSPTPFALVLVLVVWYLEATRRCDPPTSRRQHISFGGALFALVIAFEWPVSELARHVSLLALVFQRELLMLATAPLLLYAIPIEVGARLTRPAIIDTIVARLFEPVPALALSTVTLGVTAMPFAVSAESHNAWLRFVVALATLGVGFVIWNPVIRRVPGVRNLSPIGKALYLVAQSFAPTYLSFAWIFAPHDLYHSLRGQQAVLGISPLLDQRLSGYLAKLVTFGVLWPVAYHFFAHGIDGTASSEERFEWSDLERRLERAHRQEKRARRGASEEDVSPLDSYGA